MSGNRNDLRQGIRTETDLATATSKAAVPREVVGQSVRKIDGEMLARGEPVFTDDVSLPGMLYAKVLRSPHAHARIVAVDASRALALPEVVAVLRVRLGRACHRRHVQRSRRPARQGWRVRG